IVRRMEGGPLRPALLPVSTARLLRAHAASGSVVRGWPSLVKGAGLRILSRRGSQVQILPHASSRMLRRPVRGLRWALARLIPEGQKWTFDRNRAGRMEGP